MRRRGETALAIFTLVLVAPYAVLETYHYFKYIGFGQGILNYLVDVIAIALLLLGSVASLRVKPRSASGWLAAAWGFAACLNYRSFSWRYQARLEDTVTGSEPDIVFTVLGFTLIVSFLALGLALYLARPQETTT